MAQYFARKPPQTLEKLLQKMDEYIWADNDFHQRREEAYRFSEMTRGFGGRIHPRHVKSIHRSNQNDDKGGQPQRSEFTSQSLGQQQSSFRPPAPRGRGARGFEEDMGISQGRSIVCSVVRTRAILQECAKSPFRSKRRSQKPKPDKISRSRSCTLLRAILPTYQNMWAIILQLMLLRLFIHRLPGHSSHPHHHYNRPILEVSSQKGASTPNSNMNSGRNPKLAQSTVLCQNQSTFIE
jgi:hypothetical protein